MHSKLCMVCGKPCKNRFWVCRPCAQLYGMYMKPYREWPSWVRGLIRSERRVIRQQHLASTIEILVDPYTLEQVIDENHIRNQGY